MVEPSDGFCILIHPKKYMEEPAKWYKFLSEVCFEMIFSYFAIDIMDIYGPNGM